MGCCPNEAKAKQDSTSVKICHLPLPENGVAQQSLSIDSLAKAREVPSTGKARKMPLLRSANSLLCNPRLSRSKQASASICFQRMKVSAKFLRARDGRAIAGLIPLATTAASNNRKSPCLVAATMAARSAIVFPRVFAIAFAQNTQSLLHDEHALKLRPPIVIVVTGG
jgi:hypothetical protein